MDESDLKTEHAAPWRVVDQLGTSLGKVRESCADVGDLVRDVMHSGASLGQEASHRRVPVERPKQLEPALADPNGCRFDPLLLDPRAVLEPGAKEALVRVEGTVQILYCESDVVH
jgi:hypothetical protein